MELLFDGSPADSGNLLALAKSYGEPDIAWFSGKPRSLLFRQGSGTEHGEWDTAVASLGDDALTFDSGEPYHHVHVLRPSAVREASYSARTDTLSVSLAGHGRLDVRDVTPEEFAGLVAAMPGDSWHTPLPR